MQRLAFENIPGGAFRWHVRYEWLSPRRNWARRFDWPPSARSGHAQCFSASFSSGARWLGATNSSNDGASVPPAWKAQRAKQPEANDGYSLAPSVCSTLQGTGLLLKGRPRGGRKISMGRIEMTAYGMGTRQVRSADGKGPVKVAFLEHSAGAVAVYPPFS